MSDLDMYDMMPIGIRGPVVVSVYKFKMQLVWSLWFFSSHI